MRAAPAASAARRRLAEAGMTLVELVATIAIMAVVGMGISALVIIMARGTVVAVNVADAADAGTLASDRITLEVREMRGPASLGLKSMTGSELAFFDWQGNEIHYKMSATSPGTLVRSANGGAEQPLAEGVEGFAVTYWDATGSPASAAWKVARVDFQFDAVRGTVALHYGGQVFPPAFNPEVANWREE